MATARRKFPKDLEGATYQQALRQFVIEGWVPEKPPLDREGLTITQGSCFAEHVSDSLNEGGMRSVYNHFHENANSPMANALYFQYGIQQKPYRIANHALSFAPNKMKALRELVPTASTFIFTLGVALIPTRNGHIDLHDPTTPDIGWRFTDVAENVACLSSVVKNLRAVNPEIKIVLTVSPIPLSRGMGVRSAMTDDCLSKSILRVAVAEFMAANHPNVYYWPSFEAIRWLGGHVGPLFGSEGSDQRHPGQSYVNTITAEFIKAFYG